MRVAYLINQYPKVSHTFIRREILALEEGGVAVSRFALRGWDAAVADPVDAEEQRRTRYLLQGGAAGLLLEALAWGVAHPARAWRGLRSALGLGRRGDRGRLVHLVYLAEAIRLVRALTACDVRHLHAHFGTNPAAVALLCRAVGGPPFSFTVHGPEEFDKPAALHLADKVQAAAFVVAISSYGRSQLWRLLPYVEWGRVRVVHCGLETAFFVAPADVRPQPAPRLVCVGRLCEQKGQMLLVRAAGVLAREGVAFELVLAGDGEMRAEIEHEIKRQGLAGRVRITGWIGSDTVRDELMSARALALPSFAEGLPVVLMEAMAVGRPVVTTFVAGIPELVRDRVDGWLVPAGDEGALVDALRDCLGADEDRLATMGRAACERVAARHDIRREAQRLREAIVAAAGGES